MKCAYCDNVAPTMPTVFEFLGIEIKTETDLGVCEGCQKLPRSELVKKARETTERRITEAAEAILKSREQPQRIPGVPSPLPTKKKIIEQSAKNRKAKKIKKSGPREKSGGSGRRNRRR